ncbi:hypothetical protein D9M71_256690 [compost metagenome]
MTTLKKGAAPFAGAGVAAGVAGASIERSLKTLKRPFIQSSTWLVNCGLRAGSMAGWVAMLSTKSAASSWYFASLLCPVIRSMGVLSRLLISRRT